jgi:ABC-type glycerol-3-phosphate transport system substrate-binding protein
MPQMTLEKFFVDWNTIPYINLEEPWWYQNITNDLCFGDKVYAMTGDYVTYVGSIDCLVFNKDIFDDLGLEYPYQDVLDGTWTFEKFTELVKKGAKDLDGNGIMEADKDQYGLVGWGYEIAPALLVSSGFSPLDRDADNMPVLNQNTSEAHDIYQKIVDIFADGQTAFAAYDNDWSLQYTMFTEGRAMFKDLFLSEITGYKEVEFDFGVVPYPKWDENSPYMNRSSNMSPLTYIPVTNTNLELTGAVLEELAFQIAKKLTPTYFDVVLTVKQTRDVQSEEMLPIIKNNARFLYHDFVPYIVSMVNDGNNTYSSTFASSLSSYQEGLEEMRELLLGKDE